MDKYLINDEIIAACALNRICGYTPAAGLALIETFGSASEVFKATRDSLREVIGPKAGILGEITAKAADDAEIELRQIYNEGGRFLPCTDPTYPVLLSQCSDRPVGLYIKGEDSTVNIFGHAMNVSIVGTRDISQYGKTWCTRIVHALAESGTLPCIVSGLAIGADITAHTAALDAGLPTIAVMATGIDDVYPFRHGYAAQKISSAPGSALISDFPPGTPPVPIHFLRRNRIIAGLSTATILVESKPKGGGMITARLASDYNRDVYALPGRVDDLRSKGCNILLRDKIAEAITSPEDLVFRLAGDTTLQNNRKDPVPLRERIMAKYSSLNASEAEDLSRLAAMIGDSPDISCEELCSATGWSYAKVSSLICRMECDGIIETDILQHCRLNAKFM